MAEWTDLSDDELFVRINQRDVMVSTTDIAWLVANRDEDAVCVAISLLLGDDLRW